MSGAISYGLIIDVARSKGIREFDDLLHYTSEVERLLMKNRDKK